MTSATKGINSTVTGEKDTHKFRMTCSKFETFEAGAQVFIRYGNYSNRQLLIHYGFAMKDNVFSYARIKVALENLLNNRQKQVLSGGYKLSDVVVFKVKNNEFCIEMLKSFRGFLWDVDVHDPEAFLNAKDLELDLEACGIMKNFLENYFRGFTTSIEEDERLLSQVTYKAFFAVIHKQVAYRLGYKNVIKKQIQLVKILEQILRRLLNGEGNVLGQCESEPDNGKT